MRSRLLYLIAATGLLLGLLAAWFFSEKHPPQPPVFTPASNPYANGIYATGIIESGQDSGANIPIYPEVVGPVVGITVSEGQAVRKGAALLTIDSSVQQQVVAQQKAQADAARSLLSELRAQPRPEALAVARAQVESAAATVQEVKAQFEKQQRSYEIDSRSVSKESLDTASNALKVAEANLGVAQRQLELVKAGAWAYDIDVQEQSAAALQKQYEASSALLEKYTLRAPLDGIVLAINTALGGYVSPSGTYQTYTEGNAPVVVMSREADKLGVRVYVDEILVHRLPAPDKLVAQMQIRGTQVRIPLSFVRIQPYVTPKIELSNERQELVDLRVLPVLFSFSLTDSVKVYPGQLVDVYIGTREGK